MRKPRDYDAELKALQDKANALKQRKVLQLGELVIATGADALDPETLAGGAAYHGVFSFFGFRRYAFRARHDAGRSFCHA